MSHHAKSAEVKEGHGGHAFGTNNCIEVRFWLVPLSYIATLPAYIGSL